MTSCAEGHHTAFVIMPFGVEFDAIYESFFKPVLTSAGFEVHRADELTSAEGIMRTIIRRLADSCIIVADLSDSNPNVYYELGLAHAMHKPVINLAQEVDELPFDIKGHRVIPYSTYFRTMDKAKADLGNAAKGVFTGATIFGNPFSDHSHHDIVPTCLNGSKPTSSRNNAAQSLDQDPDQDGALGILDHQAAMEEGFEDIRASIEAFGAETTKMTNRMNQFNSEIKASNNDPSKRPDQARRQRTLVRLLAQDMNSYARFLSTENDNYSEAIERTRPSLEASLAAIEPSTEEDSAVLQEFLSSLDGTEEAILSFRTGTTEAMSIIRQLPHIERSFTRARDQVADQLRRLAGNIDQIISMIARAREMAQAKLDVQFSGS